jgi:hypothetical protein
MLDAMNVLPGMEDRKIVKHIRELSVISREMG